MMENIQVFRDNLAWIREREEALANTRQAQYDQIAAAAAQEWSRDVSVPERIAGLYAELWQERTDYMTPDFAVFCRQCSARFPAFPPFRNARDMDREWEEAVGERTAYMQNGYTDRAWRSFAARIPGLTAEYFPSYPAVCEEVYDSRCRYCIMPLYTTADGPLVSFRKLIGKYDLKISMVTEVEMADETVMRFALLRRGLVVSDAPEKLDLSVVLDENASVTALTGACEVFGAKVTAIHTFPLEYAGQMQEYCLETDVTTADLAGLSLFLESSQMRYTVEGLYTLV